MIAQSISLCDLMSKLVSYPTDDVSFVLAECSNCLESGFPELFQTFKPFAEGVKNKSLTELEELYTQTFDINPVSALEIGWHLYGETYERGSFLITMREHLRRSDIPESQELPDHLSHVLKVMGKFEKMEASQFSHNFFIPALTKMNESFKDDKNPYKSLLGTLLKLGQSFSGSVA